MKGIKDGVIHIHSEYSLKDGAQDVKSLVNRCGELGARGIVLTDHGTLSGYKAFVNAVADYNASNNTKIKAIPGVETYYEEDNDLTHRKHLVLIPTDNEGFRALCHIVTDSNKRLDSKDFPRINEEILLKHIGPGAYGHGHVIASSACVIGVLSSVLLENSYIQKNMSQFEKKLSTLYSPESEYYKAKKAELTAVQETIEEKKEAKNAAQLIAKKVYKKKLNALAKLEGTPEYDDMKAALDAEMQETEDAKEAVETIKEEIIVLKLNEKRLKEDCKEQEKDHDKWRIYTNALNELKAQMTSEEELYEKAKAEALRYENIFGKGNFYIELQNHRLPDEIKVFPILAKIAEELHFPIIATNDAHITRNTPDELKKRQIIRSLRFNKWEEMSDCDKEMYIKDDEELSAILQEILPRETVEKAMRGIGEIIDRCELTFEKVNHYPKFVSEIPGETAEECLERIARKGIAWRYGSEWNEEYEKRLQYELSVIKKLDVCDYLCVVEDFLRYGRLLGKIDITSKEFTDNPFDMKNLERLAAGKVGLGIGPGRGSAVGSIVCYLTGITSIDPMKYNLIFERFLNVERVTMPDIDSDFKPDIRAWVIEYVKHKYGEGAVCQVMTKQTQGAKAAVRNCARLLGSEKYDDTKTFLSLGDRIAKEIPSAIGTTLDDCWGNLVATFKDDHNAMEILNNAKLVEGTIVTTGLHAAAVIIADNGNVSDYAPLLYNTKKEQWACQCDKDEAEAIGLLKMDFLGLRNLGIITETLKHIKGKRGVSVDVEKLPMEPAVFANIFATGNTNSVFQFESNGMKQMLQKFKPSSIEDIILLVAAYRPGPMQYLDDIIAVKHGQKKPEYVIPEMAEVLGTTYGKPVYQEQIMQIFNRFAGFSLGESDIIRRYMSKKKVEKFAAYKDKFIDGLVKNGADRAKAEDFWSQLLDFSRYAFNKSHAAAYAFVAYYTAWLKYHYPVEYLTAVMNDTPFEKLGGLINDCRIFKIPVLPPRVNESDSMFSISDDGASIIYGLSLVKDVAQTGNNIVAERNNNGRFTSFADFMLRTRCEKDAAESLCKAGAFDEFTKSRAALLLTIPDYCGLISKINAKNKIIQEAEKSEKSIENAKRSVKALKSALNEIQYDRNGDEDISNRLREEKEKTGAYISGHPLEFYPRPKQVGATSIKNINETMRYASIIGVIKNLRETNRKSDGAKMAFFELEDLTGTMKINCFVNSYAQNKNFIAEDAVVKVSGEVRVDTFESFSAQSEEDEATTETILVINAEKVEQIASLKPKIIIEVSSVLEWARIQPVLSGYFDPDGYDLYVKDNVSGYIRQSERTVNKAILNDERILSYETK